MKLKELVDHLSWLDVKETLTVDQYSHSEVVDLENVWNQLKVLTPAPTKMRICIEWVDESKTVLSGLSSAKYWDIHGHDGTLNKETEDFKFFKDTCTEEFANEELAFALEFIPWNEWLSMEIEPDIFKDLSKAEIMELCLDEMTMVGYDESLIQNQLKTLKQRVDEIKNMSADELRKHTSIFKEKLDP